MKIVLWAAIVLSTIFLNAQEQTKSSDLNLYGGFESNTQWYLNDKGLNFDHPENPLRSNNYLFVNLKYKNLIAGIQGESYEAEPLLNFNTRYNKTDVATYFLQFKNEKIDLTAGYFYEQFGSGLLYRSWEDRALGINNSLRGARVIFKPNDYITIKSIYGRQRSGFVVSDGEIYGVDTEIILSDLFKMKTSELIFGLTYVGRDEPITTTENPTYNSLTNGYAARLDFSYSGFYFSSEYNIKSRDAIVEVVDQINDEFIKPGSALLLNTGYSKKGFGIDATFRRLEHMTFFSERLAKGNAFNDRIMNFVPSLTKQHHYNLANIYVYQAQPNVLLGDETLLKTGEIGGQIDVFYNFKKNTPFGGKYGTKVAVNLASWNALGGTFFLPKKDYETDFFGFGKKFFSDYNIEITKKFSPKLQAALMYINQYYNKKLIEETSGLVRTNILGGEATYKFTDSQSIRFLGEHMWADSDRKNWAAATIEINLNSNWSFYQSDLYNYGNDDPDLRNHYFNIGGAFRQKSTRIALNYGRQRGGLVCVGGVCRFVPESSGVTVSLNTTF